MSAPLHHLDHHYWPTPDLHLAAAPGRVGRWKQVIGPKMKTRCFPNQRTEAKIGTRILNKMNGLDRAKFEAIS